MVFNVGTSASAKKLMAPPQSPVLLILRATVDTYLRQGTADVVATTSDVLLLEGSYFPIVVESAFDNYVSAVCASGTGLLYASVVSTVNGVCGSSDFIEFGIYGGGQTSGLIGTVVSTMFKYLFATGTSSVSSASLASATTGLTGIAATGDGQAARFCGGQYGTASAGTGATDTIQKYEYLTDTISISGYLSQIWYGCKGNANSTAGYLQGGTVAGNVAATTSTKILWSNESISSPGSWATNNNGTGRYAFGTSTVGFWCGGGSTGVWQQKQKLLYATDTFSQVTIVLVDQRNSDNAQHGFGNTVYGWMVGGANSAGTPIATSERMTYATETSASSTSLSAARGGGASTGNTSQGVICAGKVGAPYAVNTSDVVTYATDTIAAGATVIVAVAHGAATSPTQGGLQ